MDLPNLGDAGKLNSANMAPSLYPLFNTQLAGETDDSNGRSDREFYRSKPTELIPTSMMRSEAFCCLKAEINFDGALVDPHKYHFVLAAPLRLLEHVH